MRVKIYCPKCGEWIGSIRVRDWNVYCDNDEKDKVIKEIEEYFIMSSTHICEFR